MSLTPVVGYQGGKRRLLKRLRPLFPITMSMYVEPFVGMGANYLDLRDRGYKHFSILSDSNPQVADFWRYVHEDGLALIDAARVLEGEPPTAERFYQMVEEHCDGVERVARFLWLTNFAYGNVPKVYEIDHWSRQGGTKLTSAERWGKKFPWKDCVARLEKVVQCCQGTPCLVLSSCEEALSVTRLLTYDSEVYVYADPPYTGERGYKGASAHTLQDLFDSNWRVVLSESPFARVPSHWHSEEGELTARTSGGIGANGNRKEVIYWSPR